MTKNEAINILIVDDHEMVRRGLKMFLLGYDDLAVVGEAASGEEAVQFCEQIRPDVILMDLALPGMSGVEAIQHIHQTHPDIHIIVLSGTSGVQNVRDAIQAGATSYLMKTVADDELADSIRVTQSGQRVLCPEATQALVYAATHPTLRPENLSSRENEILLLMSQGLNNAEIADRLYLSRATVKYHIGRLLSKLGAANRSEAIAIAFKQGIV